MVVGDAGSSLELGNGSRIARQMHCARKVERTKCFACSAGTMGKLKYKDAEEVLVECTMHCVDLSRLRCLAARGEVLMVDVPIRRSSWNIALRTFAVFSERMLARMASVAKREPCRRGCSLLQLDEGRSMDLGADSRNWE